jgi:hypothetical protein
VSGVLDLAEASPGETVPVTVALGKPVALVEVVSPGSDKTDRVGKMGEYASAGIPFYWLV